MLGGRRGPPDMEGPGLVVQILSRAEADEQLRRSAPPPPPVPDVAPESSKGKGVGKGKSGGQLSEADKKKKYMAQMKEKLDQAAAEDPEAAEEREKLVQAEFARVKSKDKGVADRKLEERRPRSPQRASSSSHHRSPVRRRASPPIRLHSPHRSHSLRRANSPHHSPRRTRSPYRSHHLRHSRHSSRRSRSRSPHYSPRRSRSPRHSSRRDQSPRHAHHSRRDPSPRRHNRMEKYLPPHLQVCIEKADDLRDVSADLFTYVGHSTAAYAVKKRLGAHLPVVPHNRFHYDNRQGNRGAVSRPAPAAPAPIRFEVPLLDPSEAEQFSGPWRNAQMTPSVASLVASSSYVAPDLELRPSVLAPLPIQVVPEGLDAVADIELVRERQPEPPPPGSA